MKALYRRFDSCQYGAFAVPLQLHHHSQQQQMPNINNYRYRKYVWSPVHSEIYNKCLDIRRRFREDLSSEGAMTRERIFNNYVNDESLLSIVIVPVAEIVAVLQWHEMRNESNEVKCALAFDAVCNLWNYIGDAFPKDFSKMEVSEQLEKIADIKQEFLYWYSINRKISIRDSLVLREAIYMPLLHKVIGHSLGRIMISYLLQ